MEQGTDKSRFVRYGALGSCENFSGCSPSTGVRGSPSPQHLWSSMCVSSRYERVVQRQGRKNGRFSTVPPRGRYKCTMALSAMWLLAKILLSDFAAGKSVHRVKQHVLFSGSRQRIAPLQNHGFISIAPDAPSHLYSGSNCGKHTPRHRLASSRHLAGRRQRRTNSHRRSHTARIASATSRRDRQ